MSSLLPKREQAIELLKKNQCPPQIINHCLAVNQLAVEIAQKLQANGIKIDLELVEIGALLHDLGRSKSHNVDHGLVGSQIARSMGLPQQLVDIIKRHVGGGISEEEAEQFGWPKDVYMPQTLEEKVVCYADKLIDHTKRTPIEVEIERLEKDNKGEAAERVRRLHSEITDCLVVKYDGINASS